MLWVFFRVTRLAWLASYSSRRRSEVWLWKAWAILSSGQAWIRNWAPLALGSSCVSVFLPAALVGPCCRGVAIPFSVPPLPTYSNMRPRIQRLCPPCYYSRRPELLSMILHLPTILIILPTNSPFLSLTFCQACRREFSITYLRQTCCSLWSQSL